MTRSDEQTYALQIEQLILISDSVPALISYVDRDLRYQFCNRSYSEWFGLTREQILGKPMVDVLGAEAMNAIRPHLEQALRGQVADFEVAAAYKHGGKRWIRAMYMPHRNDQGVVGLVILVTDITEHKRLESALRESEGRLRLFIEHAPAAVAMFDCEMRYMAASRRWRDDYHIIGDIPGRSHYELFPDLPERWKEVHRRGLSGETLRAEEDLFVCRDGSSQWIQWEVRPWYTDQDQVGGILVAADEVTTRVRAKQALLEQQRVLESVTDNATVALFITDEHEHCTFMNPAAEKLTGYSLSELRDRSLHDVIHHSRRDGSRYLVQECPICRAFAENNQKQGEDVFVHRNGFIYDVAFAASPIRESSGRAIGTVIELRNITQEKQAANELRESEERHRQLAEALRQADRRKDEFLAMLAHELRNPLAPIQTAAYVLERVGSGNSKIERMSEIVTRQVRHMSRLLDDLLDVSRITRGKITLQCERLNVAELARNVVEDHRSSIEQTGLQFQVDLPAQPIYVHGDKTRLAQVFSNLLQNAQKFTPAGGSIHFTLTREENHAIVRVRDTGIGMPPELIRQIFEPFVQATTSLDRSKGGLGLGLALSKGIIQLHGGEITALSRGEGTGSTFEVKLALLDENSPNDPQSPANESSTVDLERNPSGGGVISASDDDSKRL